VNCAPIDVEDLIRSGLDGEQEGRGPPVDYIEVVVIAAVRAGHQLACAVEGHSCHGI